MDGTIGVESEVMKGTHFKIMLPSQPVKNRQEYYNSDDAKLSYDAELQISFLEWLKTPTSENYREILSINKDMLASYDSKIWLVNVKKLGIISEDDRKWFVEKVLLEILKRGCKKIVLVKNEDDGKGFAYWQKMINATKTMEARVEFYFDFDVALKMIKEEVSFINK